MFPTWVMRIPTSGYSTDSPNERKYTKHADCAQTTHTALNFRTA